MINPGCDKSGPYRKRGIGGIVNTDEVVKEETQEEL